MWHVPPFGNGLPVVNDTLPIRSFTSWALLAVILMQAVAPCCALHAICHSVMFSGDSVTLSQCCNAHACCGRQQSEADSTQVRDSESLKHQQHPVKKCPGCEVKKFPSYVVQRNLGEQVDFLKLAVGSERCETKHLMNFHHQRPNYSVEECADRTDWGRGMCLLI